MSTIDSYAPSPGALYDAAAGEGLEPADRVVRLAAFLADGIAAFVMICLPAVLLLLAVGALDDGVEVEGTTLATAGFLCFTGFVSWASITALLVARNGQTLGKRLLEIKVVRTDGSPASLGRIFWLRNVVNTLLGVIPLYGIVDLMFIFGVRRQCIHDLIADTIVVRA